MAHGVKTLFNYLSVSIASFTFLDVFEKIVLTGIVKTALDNFFSPLPAG